jgi:phosphoribosyl 1,2-cyclic phosphodiesterase
VKSSFGDALFSKLEIIPFEQKPFTINDTIQISPFNISHDAMKVTSGFSFMESSGNMFSYAADLGHFPDSLIDNFRNSKIIAIEANHDADLLWKNPYRPYIHKKRVAGDYGHLSNNQSADAICRILEQSHTAPEKVILCHLSKDHNSPELAKETISGILEKRGIKLQILVAKRDERTMFFEL